MEYLEDHDDIVACNQCLERADALINKYAKFPNRAAFQATTYNSYACYWRRRSGAKKVRNNNLGAQYLAFASRCVEKAVMIEQRIGEDATTTPGTLINFAAVLS